MKNIYSLFIGIFIITSINLSIDAQTFSPARGATGVSTSPTLTITFSSNVTFGDDKDIRIYKYDNGYTLFTTLYTGDPNAFPAPTPRDSRLGGEGTTILQIDLTGSNLEYSTEYRVYSQSSAIFVGGSVWDNLTDATYWTFTTTAAPTPPSITKYNPAVNDTTVRLTDTLKLTFNENIKLDRGYLKIKNCSDSSNFAALEYNDSHLSITDSVLSITHTTFKQDSCYFVSIDSGFVQSVATSTDFPGISDATEWTFTSVKVRNWVGGTSTDWTNSANWDSNGDFVNGAVVNIPTGSTNPVISSGSVTVADLIIEAGGGLSVNSGATLTVNKTIELKSNTTANAFFLCNGTLNYSSSEIKIHQNIANSSRWYYISSPISNATKTSIGCTGDMYYWDNATGLWKTMDASTTLDVGKGYLLKSSNSLVFTGSIKTNNDTVNIDYGKSVGWNLIGNPFTNSIDWDDVILTSDSIFNGFWLYQNTDKIYGSYNGTTNESVNLSNGSIIPSNHNFWVRLDTTVTESVIFTSACKTTSTGTYLKNATTNTEFPLFKFAAINGSNNDEVIIAFTDTTNTPLKKLNMTKKFSTNSSYIQPYFKRGEKDLCMVGYQNFTSKITIPFSFKIDSDNQSTSFSIERRLIANFPDNIVILLEDLQTGQSNNFLQNATYSFTETRKGDITDRFQITFRGDISTAIAKEINNSDNNIEIWSNNKLIYLNINNNLPADIEIYNISGQIIDKYKNISSDITIPINNQGIYIVRVSQNGVFITKKVFVK